MSQYLLRRVILALVVLQLGCPCLLVEAHSRRYPQGWIQFRWPSFLNFLNPAPNPLSQPSQPLPPIPAPPPVQSLPQPSLPPLVSRSQDPLPAVASSSIQLPVTSAQASHTVLTSSSLPLPTPSSIETAPVATSSLVSSITSPSTTFVAPVPSFTPTLQATSTVSAPSASSVPEAVSNQTPGVCTNPRVRPEWRTLSRQQQASYINAVKCLAKLPSKLLPGGDYRRYDDFQNVHSRMRTRIHWMALFLPWHRHFMFLFEQALRNECGYNGNLPRWDWTLDSQDMTKSPIWSADPQVGFGSNGRNFTNVNPALDGGVVTDGAFANWDLYYPEYHQLQRSYNLPSQYRIAGRSWGSQFFDQAAISRIQRKSSYAEFAVALEGTDPASTGPSDPGPHSIIHVIIGGDISPTSYAANEPLFYLHHTNVDYHWWRWQNAQRSTRLNAYGGPTARGSTRNTARLSDTLNFLGFNDDVRVQETMDTYSAKYCYRY